MKIGIEIVIEIDLKIEGESRNIQLVPYNIYRVVKRVIYVFLTINGGGKI